MSLQTGNLGSLLRVSISAVTRSSYKKRWLHLPSTRTLDYEKLVSSPSQRVYGRRKSYPLPRTRPVNIPPFLCSREFSSLRWTKSESSKDDFDEAVQEAMESALEEGKQAFSWVPSVAVIFHYGYEKSDVTISKQKQLMQGLGNKEGNCEDFDTLAVLSCSVNIKRSVITPVTGMGSGERFVSCTVIFLENKVIASDGRLIFHAPNDSLPDFSHWTSRLPVLLKSQPLFAIFSSSSQNGSGNGMGLFYRLDDLFPGSNKFCLSLPSGVSPLWIKSGGQEEATVEAESAEADGVVAGFGFDGALNGQEVRNLVKHFLNETFKKDFSTGYFVGSNELMEEFFLPKGVKAGDSFAVALPKGLATKRLPIFRLPVFMYPGVQIPLRIFEPRYKSLVKYCIEKESPFGIIHPESECGCVVNIVKVDDISNSAESIISVQGAVRFRSLANSTFEDFGLEFDDVEMFEDVGAVQRNEMTLNTEEQLSTELSLRKSITNLLEEFNYKHFIQTNGNKDIHEFSFAVAHELSHINTISDEEKLKWLEISDVNERLELLKNALLSLRQV